ncbi:hypothetical protein BT67DRAFT_440179 [Trichocladium antarcticum]|uniref:Uncharacterized protein n=1 Tax=Trichocladium antarcticum TaxID=1450529 RepID=A0AAN6ZFX6_9PEZI|nr:hypothetical protein BT67DRAFT_440179 [Trichocladium antarcticum]
MAGIFDFGGRNLVDLYNDVNSRDDVFAYLDHVIANGANLNPAISRETRAELQTIRTQISLLSVTNGTEYVGDLATTPGQHIRRRATLGWPRDAPSKFEVLVNNGHRGRNHPESAALEYWSPFDLLGLFLSKMGGAPNHGTATEANFYLPLAAVYGRFCMWIGLNKRPALTTDGPEDRRQGQGVGDPSSYYQITWDPYSGQFFLGAGLAGYVWPPGRRPGGTGTWKPVVRERRYSLLLGFHNFPGGFTEWTDSPTKRHSRRDTLFGNCAETYAYLEMLGPHYDLAARERMRGIALHRDFAQFPQYTAANIMLYRDSPCMNCKQLLTWAGLTNPRDWHFCPPRQPRR